jgi:hypothetical protein
MREPRTPEQIANDIEAHVNATYPTEIARWGDHAEAMGVTGQPVRSARGKYQAYAIEDHVDQESVRLRDEIVAKHIRSQHTD